MKGYIRLHREIVVEFTGYDDFYPINHGTILETSFSDDRIPPSQFQKFVRLPSQTPILVKKIITGQLILESYPIDVIASGNKVLTLYYVRSTMRNYMGLIGNKF